MNEHDDAPLLPEGAEDFTPATDAEIEAAAELTPERIEDSKAWLRKVQPDIADRLEGKDG